MKVDPRFLKEEGREVFTGNELMVRGLCETEGGTHLWTGYPGSPVAGFFDCIESISEIPKTYGIRALMANNEALAAAMLNGAQMSGLRAIAAMKSVGVHVAADALALGNLGGAHPDGGAVLVCGEDPWSDSTQVPSDSRFLCKHLFMPVVEPSTPQELKDWIDLSFKLSRESELYIGYIVTTNQADGGGSVELKRLHFPKVNMHAKIELDTSKVDFENKVLLPPRTWRKEQDFPSRYKRLWESARRHGLNKILGPKEFSSAGPEARYPIGLVTAGLGASYLQHALEEMGLSDQVPILKLGVTYPLDHELILDFAKRVEMLVVVEERRGFIEEQIAHVLSQHAMVVPLYGKLFPHGLTGFPSTRGLNPSIVIEHLGPLLLKFPQSAKLSVDPARIEVELALLREINGYNVKPLPRTPTFCPGCPHRDSASVLVEVKKDFRNAEYMRAHHRLGPVDLVFHGDTGCYTMLMFEPTKELMHNYSGMGLGGATGLGIDAFITNKQVVFMGDGTFFHSGQVAISNSIKNGQDITYIILDNKITAMTGHQPTAGMELDLMGNHTYSQNIERIISGMSEHGGAAEIVRVNPEARDQYRTLLEQTILKNGVKIIVADKECGITYHRRQNRQERAEARDKGFVARKVHINITPDVCEYCLECTRATGCPGLTFTETDFGRKVQTDLSWCVADTACTKIHACPSFEEVTVVRSAKPISRIPEVRDEDLPTPQLPEFEREWSIYLAGVGGMGIGTSSATLVRAAHRQGYDILFCDKLGLAIRNGGVYSQISFRKPGVSRASQLIPYGKADLILGIDALEALRGLSPDTNLRIGSRARTRVVLNTVKTPTILGLLGKDDFCIQSVEQSLRDHTRAEDYFSLDVSAISERLFGTKLYANILMLGVAYQLGRLPLSLESLEYGIRETMGSASKENWQAFRYGRKVAADFIAAGKRFGEPAEVSDKKTQASDYNAVVEEKSAILGRKRGGKKLAQGYWQLVTRALGAMELDARNQALLAERVYDLIQYEDVSYASRYVDALIRMHAADLPEFGYEATQAALWNLHRVMAIKDEVYVAHLLTSEEKYARDRERYNINPELGDKAIYRHLNRPEFDIWGLKIRFHLRSQPWMLKLMRGQKWIRRLLPKWHGLERGFRDWYAGALEQFAPREGDRAQYNAWLEFLRLPALARGYREVRYPQMHACRARGEELLAQMGQGASAAKPARAAASV